MEMATEDYCNFNSCHTHKKCGWMDCFYFVLPMIILFLVIAFFEYRSSIEFTKNMNRVNSGEVIFIIKENGK